MKNNLIRGIRQASDFLMALQLTGAFKKDTLSNLQVRLPAVVIGGGVLGIEAADALRRLNLDVTILHRGPRLMDRQLDEKGGAILRRYPEGLGIAVRTKAKTARCIGTDRVTAVELEDGDMISADIVIACAGIQPNVELAKGAGLAVAKGVLVDRNMRTSDPDIFAAGDVAELPGTVSGLWAVSTSQARVAALSLFGREANYVEPNTTVSLKMDGIDVKSFGQIDAKGTEQQLIVDREETDDHHRLLVIANGKLTGAVFVGPPGTSALAGELIEKRPDMTPVIDRLGAGDWSALKDLV